jgi:hypothetical protein
MTYKGTIAVALVAMALGGAGGALAQSGGQLAQPTNPSGDVDAHGWQPIPGIGAPGYPVQRTTAYYHSAPASLTRWGMVSDPVSFTTRARRLRLRLWYLTFEARRAWFGLRFYDAQGRDVTGEPVRLESPAMRSWTRAVRVERVPRTAVAYRVLAAVDENGARVYVDDVRVSRVRRRGGCGR